MRTWEANNPEKVKAIGRKQYERRKNDPEYIKKTRAYHAQWQRDNKDKWNAYCREWRKKRREAEMNRNMYYLTLAGDYAKSTTGCTKVSVGSCIKTRDNIIVLGANRVINHLCQSKGCLRIEKYGNSSKAHRNPEDCRAIHSEVDAIGNAARRGANTAGATIYVTRYPCEACARAIVAAGIKHVVYGRNQLISPMTEEIFRMADVDCHNLADYMEEDTVE